MNDDRSMFVLVYGFVALSGAAIGLTVGWLIWGM